MGNATQNLKNMGNSIKSLTMDEQMEPFQKKMAQGYSKKKKIMITYFVSCFQEEQTNL